MFDIFSELKRIEEGAADETRAFLHFRRSTKNVLVLLFQPISCYGILPTIHSDLHSDVR